MSETFDLILKNGTVVNHDGQGARDIGVTDGRIAAIGSLGAAQAGETIDCTGLHILPGVIDSQVHFREPGLEHKADLETEARAAALGGVEPRGKAADSVVGRRGGRTGKLHHLR